MAPKTDDQVQRLTAENEQLRRRVAELEVALRAIADTAVEKTRLLTRRGRGYADPDVLMAQMLDEHARQKRSAAGGG